VQDRTIYEDAEIFARTLHDNGAMDERDFDNYMSLFQCMTSYLLAPNAIIYLRASVDTLVERIRLRGRDYEKDIDRDYLSTLNRAYDDWAARSAPDLRFVVVDTDGLDCIEEHPRLVKLLRELESGIAPDRITGD
jgi:deoxyadenosine/deoxycytidine kinase